MLKALFLDMDETLCDTQGANQQATRLLGEELDALYGGAFDGHHLADGCARFLARRVGHDHPGAARKGQRSNKAQN